MKEEEESRSMKEEEEEEEEEQKQEEERRNGRVGKLGGCGRGGAQMQSQHSWFGPTPCCGNSLHLRRCLTDPTLSGPGQESRRICWSLKPRD